MKEKTVPYNGRSVRTVYTDTVVVGTGAAGFNAALRLEKLGREAVIVTEGINTGTSRNTGSDKQTYYKMNLCADYPDSPKAMASDMFAGGCVDGDIAYAEAAHSVQCFMQLAELGVPFPTNRYGEYVGYKTDHDPRARATSAGPLTSKLMTECLEKEVNRRNITIYDGFLAVSVVKDEKSETCGLFAIDKSNGDAILFCCPNVIFATGGPAGIYASTVYPIGHTGSSGVIFEAGAFGRNLTEWQYGLASVSPRWNVSGTYMQVLPRFVSVEKDGTEHEFLDEHFNKFSELLSAVFKKGYEWPFDSRKLPSGSSVIDLLVYRETAMRGRKVFLDYTKNPHSVSDIDYNSLSPEASDYLKNANAAFGTPIERLIKMNEPAYELYLSKGVDLKKEMLQIDLCAQHNNGGAAVDMWWQTDIKGLFAVGEAAGTHGIYRPGGSALNAGQVGSTRAAMYISQNRPSEYPAEKFAQSAAWTLEKHFALAKAISSENDNTAELTEKVTSAMTAAGGAIRTKENILSALSDVTALLNGFAEAVKANGTSGLIRAYKLRDILICQSMYLYAMYDFTEKTPMTRGSALYTAQGGTVPVKDCKNFAFLPYDGSLSGRVQEISYDNGKPTARWRDVRPLPEGGGFFENVWADYRENKNIY